jgi:hypothetical protein
MKVRSAIARAAVLLVATLLIAACAAGRGPGGEVIIGCDVASLAETPQEALAAAATFLPPPWNFLATGAVSVLLGGAGAAAKYRADAKAARAERAAADAAFDEGHGQRRWSCRWATPANKAPDKRTGDSTRSARSGSSPTIQPAGIREACPSRRAVPTPDRRRHHRLASCTAKGRAPAPPSLPAMWIVTR